MRFPRRPARVKTPTSKPNSMPAKRGKASAKKRKAYYYYAGKEAKAKKTSKAGKKVKKGREKEKG